MSTERKRSPMSPRRRNIAFHILPTSATMVAVCMTVIGIAMLSHPTNIRPWINRLLGLDAVIFLASVLFSYVSLRSERWEKRFEGYADVAFLGGIALMAVTGVMVSFGLL